VWRTQAHSSAAFFAWSVALGKILTLDNLRKQHVIVIDRCYMCKKTSDPPPFSPETTTEVSSGLVLNRLPPGGLEVTALGVKEGASPASSVFVGDFSRSKPSSAAVTGTESSSGGESSSSQVFPAVSSRTPAFNLFGFPPSPAPDLGFPADPASFKFTPLGKLQIPTPLSDPPSLAGAAFLGEKLYSPLPVVVSKPFQYYYRRAKKLREWHNVKWNDVLLSDSPEAVKMSIGYVDKRVTGAEPPAEKAAKPPAMKKSVTPVKNGLFRKGFLNLPSISVPPMSLQEVNNGRVVGPPLRVVALMVFPNLEIGQLVLIITGRLWCGKRMKMIIGMVCP
jgi:hypothetical protein